MTPIARTHSGVHVQEKNLCFINTLPFALLEKIHNFLFLNDIDASRTTCKLWTRLTGFDKGHLTLCNDPANMSDHFTIIDDKKLSALLKELSGKKICSIQLKDSSITDNSLAIIGQLFNLKKLCLDMTFISSLEKIKNLSLTSLSLAYCSLLSYKEFQHLSKMPLTFLDLYSTHMEDLRYLEEMPLTSLDVSQTQVRDFNALMYLHNLTHFAAAKTEIQDKDLQLLTKLPLVSLKLNFNKQITNVGMKIIENLALTSLNISYCSITDEGLKFLQKMPLRTLDMLSLNISDEGIQKNKGFPLLKFLTVGRHSSQMTDAGLAHMLAKSPLIESLTLIHLQPNGPQLEIPTNLSHLKELRILECQNVNAAVLHKYSFAYLT